MPAYDTRETTRPGVGDSETNYVTLAIVGCLEASAATPLHFATNLTSASSAAFLFSRKTSGFEYRSLKLLTSRSISINRCFSSADLPPSILAHSSLIAKTVSFSIGSVVGFAAFL